MSLIRRAAAAALGTALVAAVPALAAQSPERAQLVIGAYGGQYTHFANLTNTTPTADFRPGFNLGATIGFQLSPVVSLHSDFMLARSRARGAASFAGATVDRLFLGGHLELAADMGSGVKWYGFLGGGMVRVTQSSEAPSQDGFNAFWKPAAMGGAGMFINVPRSNLDVMIEGKVLGYEFDRAGFDRILWDATWGLGLAYRIALR
jgi:opacity protein-like surface antigen